MSMHLDHVGLSVADLDAQASWYCKAFDLQTALPFTVPPIELRGQFVTNGEITIELLERQGSKPGIQAANQAEALLTRGYGHICLRVTNVDSLYEKLISLGAGSRLAPQDSPEPGVRFAFVSDPEGNLIEFHDRKGPVA
jgi:catechol 2,3-dioxygenase-like lactoylglutathione lyase family enzyme